MIEYRIAIFDDVPTLAALRWDFRLEETRNISAADRPTFLHTCTAFLEQGLITGQWTYWVAVDDGIIVSHIFVQRISKVPKPQRLDDAYGYVTNVYTKPEYRQQGIGTTLMAHVVRWAEEQDVDILIVWPSDRSRVFYERAGFTSHTEMMEYSVRPDQE